MANNVTREEHLEALANAIKDYADSKLANISEAELKLDTVPSTVEGAMWFENSSKKLAVRHNNRIYRLPFEPLAEVIAVNVAPSSVAVMQGQSATATVSAIGEHVTGLSYGLSGAPTWITISDDVILIQPSDNDYGIANVQVFAQDTGSDAMSSAMLRAEAKLRPIIESLSVIPPAVTVQQGQSAIAGISAVANAAVTGLSYSLNGASSWVNLNGDYIYVTPTDNDLGSNTVDVIAYDTNSSASAATQFVATIKPPPFIGDIKLNYNPNSRPDAFVEKDVSAHNSWKIYTQHGKASTFNLEAEANEGVTSLLWKYYYNPDWVYPLGAGNERFFVIMPDSVTSDVPFGISVEDTGSTATSGGGITLCPTILPAIYDLTIDELDSDARVTLSNDDGYWAYLHAGAKQTSNFSGTVTFNLEGNFGEETHLTIYSYSSRYTSGVQLNLRITELQNKWGSATLTATAEDGTTLEQSFTWVRGWD